MKHAYKKIEQEDGVFRIRQLRADGTHRWVDPDYPGYLSALAAGEVETVSYVSPPELSLDEQKAGRIAHVDAKSIALLGSGFRYGGKTFDIISDQERWKELLLAAVGELLTYPVTVYARDKSSLQLADLFGVKEFCAAFMEARESVLAPGRVLKEQMAAATSVAELAVIIDRRNKG